MELLNHEAVCDMLSEAGINWYSTKYKDNCRTNDRSDGSTCFQDIRKATIEALLTLNRACDALLTVTGGTELGHAPAIDWTLASWSPELKEWHRSRKHPVHDDTYTHYNGYKLDLRLEGLLREYIESRFEKIDSKHWASAAGNLYYLEGDHWDLTVYK